MPLTGNPWLFPEDRWTGLWLSGLNAGLCLFCAWGMWSEPALRLLSVVALGMVPVFLGIGVYMVYLAGVIIRQQDEQLRKECARWR